MKLTMFGALAVVGWIGLTAVPNQEPPECPQVPASDTFARERGGELDAAKDALEGQVPPALDALRWWNTAPLKLEEQRGKVVVLAFWGLASEASVAATAEWSKLYQRETDLVLIAIHTPQGADELAQFVQDQALEFPVCVDTGRTFRAFAADSYPDYYLIDRCGKLRVADLADEDLKPALRVLLAEPDPGPLPGEAAAQEARSMRFANRGDGNGLDFWWMRNELFQERRETLLRVRDECLLVDQGLEPMAWTVVAENNERLTPRRLQKYRGGAVGEATGRDWVESFRFTRNQGVLLVDWGDQHGHTVETEIPLDTVVDLLVPRIVTQLPLEDGYTESFPLLEVWPFVEERNHQVLTRPAQLINRGRAPLELDARRTVQAWRFDLLLEGEVTWSYWVDEDRNLVQVGLGELLRLMRTE